MNGLTERQQHTLEVIRAHLAKTGRGPSCEEIAAGIGVKSKSHAKYIVDDLVSRGFLTRTPGKGRSLALVDVASVVTMLPIATMEALHKFCEAHGERPADVVADAVALHIDTMDRILAIEAVA